MPDGCKLDAGPSCRFVVFFRFSAKTHTLLFGCTLAGSSMKPFTINPIGNASWYLVAQQTHPSKCKRTRVWRFKTSAKPFRTIDNCHEERRREGGRQLWNIIHLPKKQMSSLDLVSLLSPTLAIFGKNLYCN